LKSGMSVLKQILGPIILLETRHFQQLLHYSHSVCVPLIRLYPLFLILSLLRRIDLNNHCANQYRQYCSGLVGPVTG
jgi:hypothetical protein